MKPDEKKQRYILKSDPTGVAVFDNAEEVTVKHYSPRGPAGINKSAMGVCHIVARHVAQALNAAETEIAEEIEVRESNEAFAKRKSP